MNVYLNYVRLLTLATISGMILFSWSVASAAKAICYDFDSKNCNSDSHFVNLLGDAPKHYQTFFVDRDEYFWTNVFDQYEFLVDSVVDNLPEETFGYDYSRVYDRLEEVTIFGKTPFLLNVETWSEINVGCCFSHEYTAYFNAETFDFSQTHLAFYSLYFCSASEIKMQEFLESYEWMLGYLSITSDDVPTNMVRIDCGRRAALAMQDDDL